MRRMLGSVVAAMLLVVVGAACQPTEPAMTITAKPMQPACYNDGLEGTVTPIDATSKVVLQRTVNGKWVDWKWYIGTSGESPHIISAPVSSWDEGAYWPQYADETASGVPLSGTIHIRVRSEGGTRFSNGIYVTYPKAC